VQVTVRRHAKPLAIKEKPAKGDAAPGLRARKRQETRERLTRAAMALFLGRGFDATTVDDIAVAADVSRRSFFHYFASKEDVVFAWQDQVNKALVAEVAARPTAESMLVAAENAICTMAGQVDPGEAMAMAKLKQDNPALQAHDQVKYERLERELAAALGRRAPHKSDKATKLEARLVAMMAAGAMRIGSELWAAHGAREKPEKLARRLFAAIRAILA
jgi:AcrR family transcriptional regulator